MTEIMTRDEIRTQALEALRVLGTSKDDEAREEYLASLLLIVYQSGEIAANAACIERFCKS